MCDFPVISPDLVFVVFVTTKSNPGQAAAHEAKRPHEREVLFDALSLLPIGGEKNLKGMGEVTVHGAKSLHTREDNIMLVVNVWIP